MKKILTWIAILVVIVTLVLSLHIEGEFLSINGFRILITLGIPLIVLALISGGELRQGSHSIYIIFVLITAAFVFISIHEISVRNRQFIELAIVEAAAIPFIRCIPDLFKFSSSLILKQLVLRLGFFVVMAAVTVFSFKYGADGYEALYNSNNVTIRVVSIYPSENHYQMQVYINPDPRAVYNPIDNRVKVTQYVDIKPNLYYQQNITKMYEKLQKDSLYNVKIVGFEDDYRLVKIIE